MTDNPSLGRARCGRSGRRGRARRTCRRPGLCARRLRCRLERRRRANRKTRAHPRPPRPLGRFSRLPRPGGRICGPKPRRSGSLRLVDDTGTPVSAVPPHPVPRPGNRVDVFGLNIENDRMAQALAAEVARAPRRRARRPGAAAYDRGPTLSGPVWQTGARSQPFCAVGADGRDSMARRAGGLEARAHAGRAERLDRASRPPPAARRLLD